MPADLPPVRIRACTLKPGGARLRSRSSRSSSRGDDPVPSACTATAAVGELGAAAAEASHSSDRSTTPETHVPATEETPPTLGLAGGQDGPQL